MVVNVKRPIFSWCSGMVACKAVIRFVACSEVVDGLLSKAKALACNLAGRWRKGNQKRPVRPRLQRSEPWIIDFEGAPWGTGIQLAMRLDGYLAVSVGSGKARAGASAANAVPDRAGRTLRLAVEDFIDGEAVADSLQDSKGIEKIRLPAGVCADQKVHRAKRQIDLAQTLEVLDDNAFDHANVPSVNTRKPSLPRGSITLTATFQVSPAASRAGRGKGRLRKPLSASNAPGSTVP